MIAPAWPIRLPGGAVCPAMNATTGLRTFSRMYAAACSSSVPPISPIITIACVSASCSNISSSSMKFTPLTGSPPIPTHVVCANPRCEHCQTASYVSVPLREMMPTFFVPAAGGL